jgi:hypothetical protein
MTCIVNSICSRPRTPSVGFHRFPANDAHAGGNFLKGASMKVDVNHFNYKGDRAGVLAGRWRARKIYPLRDCEVCGKPGKERHHKDENTLNNEPENVQVLCRRCHAIAHEEIYKLRGRTPAQIEAARRKIKPATACCNCGRIEKPQRHGRCTACAYYFWRTGKERVANDVQRTG